jgi:hypothetical protein
VGESRPTRTKVTCHRTEDRHGHSRQQRPGRSNRYCNSMRKVSKGALHRAILQRSKAKRTTYKRHGFGAHSKNDSSFGMSVTSTKDRLRSDFNGLRFSKRSYGYKFIHPGKQLDPDCSKPNRRHEGRLLQLVPDAKFPVAPAPNEYSFPIERCRRHPVPMNPTHHSEPREKDGRSPLLPQKSLNK